MKFKATIKSLGTPIGGVNQRTGNPWTGRPILLEVIGEEGVKLPSLIHCMAFNENVMYLEQCKEGDQVDAIIRIYSEEKKGINGPFWTVNTNLESINLVNNGGF